jgi:hypothetical protein
MSHFTQPDINHQQPSPFNSLVSSGQFLCRHLPDHMCIRLCVAAVMAIAISTWYCGKDNILWNEKADAEVNHLKDHGLNIPKSESIHVEDESCHIRIVQLLCHGLATFFLTYILCLSYCPQPCPSIYSQHFGLSPVGPNFAVRTLEQQEDRVCDELQRSYRDDPSCRKMARLKIGIATAL